MSQLFNIQTQISTQGEVVRIVAAKPVRSAIWNLVTNDALNPGVARYDGGAPTVVTLKPYPGYDGALVENMAYAFACLASWGDWATLFCTSITEYTKGLVTVEGFTPDPEVVAEFQRLYVAWKSVSSLQKKVNSLGLIGHNTSAVIDWNHEAIECFRRADSPNRATIEQMVEDVGEYAREARKISATKAANRRILEAKVKTFELLVASAAETTKVSQVFYSIDWDIQVESNRLLDEIELHSTEFAEIRDNLMVAIRKATPPAPPTSKE